MMEGPKQEPAIETPETKETRASIEPLPPVAEEAQTEPGAGAESAPEVEIPTPVTETEPGAEAAPVHRAGFVAIVGRPNVGKSTLMNAYLGERLAIVSNKPQTTRRTIRGILTRPDVQIIFVDTPGIHRPQHALGKHMVRAAVQTLEEVDLIVMMVDGSRMPTQEDEELAEILRGRAKSPILLVLNKMDLLKREMVKEVTEAYWELVPHADWMRISASKKENLNKLLDQIIARLPASPNLYGEDELTDLPMQVMAAEFIREPVLVLTREEIPHSVAVTIDDWEDRSETLTYIAASLWVEKDSQKGIVIGERGSLLKQIGQRARADIERMIGHQVYLSLTVKVREKWRRDERLLKELGYALPD